VVVLAVLLPVATRLPAQELDSAGSEDRYPADSIRPSALEEQLTGLGEDEEAVREEAVRRPGRRAAGWRAVWKVRSGAVLQEAAGYRRGTYAGNRLKLFQALTVRNGDWLAVEALVDKDPGEPAAADFVSGAIRADFLSGGLRITAGDFRMRAGQGLLFGSPRSFGKGAAVIEPALRDSWGIPDGVSSDEAHFFRGGAVQARAGPVSVVVFGSNRTATPDFSADGGLRGVDASGYHRTAAELARKGTLSERSAGAGLSVAFGEGFAAGGSFLATDLSAAAGDDRGAGAAGASIRRGSVDLRATAGALTVFGEAIPSGPNSPWIAGVLLSDPEGRRLVIVRRFYPPADDLHATFGFADAARGSNEEGTYVGAEAAVTAAFSVSAFLDVYSRIRPVPGSVQPPSGLDRLVSARFSPSKRFAAEIRFRSRGRETGVPDAGTGPLPVPGNAMERERSIRAEARWAPEERVVCAVRVDHCTASPAGRARERGEMVTADLTVEPWRGITIDTRARLFRTDSFASGIPSVDVDLPGTISSTVYSGEGTAWSAGWTWRCSRNLRLSLRYSVLRRDDLRRIGSGPAELPSNIREKAGFLMVLSL
jgi:hypothetical protein